MIEGYKDSDYLELLAHWFDEMDKIGRFENGTPDEIQKTLRRIAAKLRRLEHDERNFRNFNEPD